MVTDRDPLPVYSRRGLRRAARGFTMLELLVVVSIIAILATIATPSFSSLIATSRAKTTATNFYLALSKARSSAIKFNANTTIAPTGGNWQSGWTTTSTAGGGGVTVSQEGAVPTGVAIAMAPANVVYTSSGRTQAAASFQITATSGTSTVQRCVTVDTGGRPYMKQSAC